MRRYCKSQFQIYSLKQKPIIKLTASNIIYTANLEKQWQELAQ